MKRTNLICALTLCSLLLAGCGGSDTTAEAPSQPQQTPSTGGSSATASKPTAPTPPQASAAATSVAQVKDVAVAKVTELGSSLLASVKGSGDAMLTSLSSDLNAKVKTLSASVATNAVVLDTVNSLLESLTGARDIDAMASLKKLSAASLTPQQTALATEVKNIAAALVTQRNLSALDGAQGDVAQIVNNLRKGEISATAPYLQKVAQNVSLTPAQKDIVASLVDQFAPGLKAAGDTVQQGLNSVNSLLKK